MILGVECLGVEKVSLKLRDEPSAPISPFDLEPREGAQKEIAPPPVGSLESVGLGRGDVSLLVHHSATSGRQLIDP